MDGRRLPAMRWQIYEGSINSTRFMEFLKDLIRDVKGKIFLIVDNVSYHKSAETRTWPTIRDCRESAAHALGISGENPAILR